MKYLQVFLQSLLVCILIHDAFAVNITINIPVREDGEEKKDDGLYVTAEDIETLEIVIVDADNLTDLTIIATSTDEEIFKIANESNTFTVKEHPVKIGVLGVFVGIENLELKLKSGDEVIMNITQIVKVKRQDQIIVTIYTWTLTAWLLISYVTMGCKMDWRIIKEKLRKPYGVLIGAFCQFIIMPALSFGIAKALNLDDSAAIGLVTVGSCPGGWLSNVFSLLLDVDFVLSLTMTFCSTVLALGFMPLNLYIYGSQFVGDNDNLETPFVDIMIQLVSLVIPVLIGMMILYKLPKVAEICLKCLKPFAMILIAISLGLGIPAQLYVFYSDWEIWVAAACLPFIGCFLGFSIAKIARLELKSSVTISLETGVQNSLLAIAMVGISYPNPESDLIGRIPLLIALLTLMEGCFVTGLKVGIERYCWTPREVVEDEKEVMEKDQKSPQMLQEINGNKTSVLPTISVAVQVGDDNFTNGSTAIPVDNPGFVSD